MFSLAITRKRDGILPWLLSAALLSVIAAYGVGQFSHLRASLAEPALVTQATSNGVALPPVTRALLPAPDIDGALSLHLFGKKRPAVTPPPPATVDELAETRLQLELIGTFTSTDTKRASSLIGEVGREANRVFVGEAMANGVVLHAVTTDAVVIDNNGTLESLWLYAKKEDARNLSQSQSINRKNTRRNASVDPTTTHAKMRQARAHPPQPAVTFESLSISLAGLKNQLTQ